MGGTNNVGPIDHIGFQMNNIAVDMPFLDVSIPTQRNNIAVDMPFLDVSIPTNGQCQDWCLNSCDGNADYNGCLLPCATAPKQPPPTLNPTAHARTGALTAVTATPRPTTGASLTFATAPKQSATTDGEQ